MASTKNNFLNAKPVSKLGGKSGGVRKPSKPYAKPPAKPKGEKPARWDTKTKTERLQEAAKTKPKTPAPRPKPKPGGAVGARPMGTADVGPKGPVGKLGERTGMSPAKPASKPAAKPNSIARGGKALAGGALLTAAAAKAAEVLGKAANPKEWERISAELKDRGYGSNSKPVKKDANGRSSTGVRVSDKQNRRDYKAAPTGSEQYNNYRNQQIAAERERLKDVGNPPKPKPSAPRPAGTQPSRPTASRPATPAAPKKPAAPASPKDRRVSAATANRESGNYGTSRTNNPMIDDAMKARMRQREDAQAGASGSSKPEDKSRYVASDGRQYKGPAFGNDAKPSSTASAKYKPAEKKMTLAERLRQRRQNIA